MADQPTPTPANTPTPATPAAHAKRTSRLGPWLAAAGAVAALATGASFAWDGYQLLQAKDALTTHAAAARQALTDRDATALTTEAHELEQAAKRFANHTDGPHWWLAAHTPWVADQAQPLIDAGQAVAAMAEGALTPLAGLNNLDALEAPQFQDGRIDPYVLEPFRETLEQAAQTLTEQQQRLDATDLQGTIPTVATPFLDLKAQLGTVRDLVQGAHVAAELLPAMLGAEAPRTYLVMVQNNAEPRTTGGIPGAIIELNVSDGRMTQGIYASASSMVHTDGIGGLTDDELRIFTTRMEIYPHNVNFTPEYPRSAQMMLRFWEASHGERADGVLSVDPVALGWMLEGAPATDVGPFQVTGENLASVMLNESYLAFEDPAEQDAFFARASADLFGRIVSGQGSALGGVERAIEAGRFMLYSDDAAEQSLLASTSVAGGFLERDDALGIFLNDGSGSKIGWYIDNETTVTDHLCRDGSLDAQTVEVTLTHTYEGAVADLPWYISGGDVYVPAGEFHVNLLLYAAVGTGVTNVTRDGEPATLNPEVHHGRSMSTVRIVLEPGQTTTVTYRIEANVPRLLPPAVVETPGPKPNVYSRLVDQVVDGC